MKGKIVLETGEIFEGTIISGKGVKTGRLVFDTRVVGYEKVLTSPEYSGKIVCFTYPLIGNYGINYEDTETEEVFPSAVIISEYSEIYSNFRAQCSLADFLKDKPVSMLEGSDTQYLTAIIRNRRGMAAGIAPADIETEKVLKEMKKNSGIACAQVKTKQDILKTGRPYIAVINLGVKKSETAALKNSEFDWIFFPPGAPERDEIMAGASGIYVTSGPENPAVIEEAASVIKKFLGRIPVFGAGTGHLAAGIASGRKISGDILNHYGINHPVSDTKENRCCITEQSHSLSLEKKSAGKTARFVNINDDTEEGQYDEDMRMMSTSFLPRDVNFKEFFSLIKGR
ncbi:MAG: carbamoyl phosphate synthase small subunit [Candidatus Omnitrophica bacterium]|nr:carbamoyl phosphate synthase small subunit [Candidatus Omnitrophota bacterium]